MSKKVRKAQKQAKKHVLRGTTTTAIMIRAVELAPKQSQAVQQPTPAMFVKEKPGRGGKKVTYVETVYVVSRLNASFSPAGWDFEVLEQGQSQRATENNSEGEVWVRGKLTIIDHKNGYKASRTQYGQHPIHKNVPVGDAFKSAASDCLKKCASLFGIAHDVYWKISEAEGEKSEAKVQAVKKTSVSESDMQKIRGIIKATSSIDALIQIDEKVKGSPIYTKEQKDEIHKLTSQRGNELDSAQ